jgi:hypothetical protein
MINREEGLRALRPSLDLAANTPTASSSAEQFQNEVLRPILKLQNGLLLAVFRQYLAARKQPLSRLPQPEQLAYVAHALRTDQKFKNRLVGLVVGQFTLEELAQFFADEAELTRRLTELLIQRIQSQLDQL